MRFIHTADQHLGFHQYMLKQRRDDFSKVFKNLILDTLEKHNPDFYVFPGDMFNSKKPDYHTLMDFRDIVKIIRGAGKSIVSSTGNHDHTGGTTWIDYFDCFDNIADVAIHRVNWSANPMQHVIEKITPVQNKFNILLMHHGTTRYYGIITDDDINRLSCFDYVALGHIHVPYVINNLFNPGSLEYTSSDLWGNPGGYFIIDVDSSGFKYQHVITNHRPTLKIAVSADNRITTSKKLIESITRKLRNNNVTNDYLVEVIINGEPHPSIMADVEQHKWDVLRLKLKTVYENADSSQPKSTDEEVDPYITVFGDLADKAKMIVNSSKSTTEVIDML